MGDPKKLSFPYKKIIGSQTRVASVRNVSKLPRVDKFMEMWIARRLLDASVEKGAKGDRIAGVGNGGKTL